MIGVNLVCVCLLSGLMTLNIPSRVHAPHKTAPILLQVTPQKNAGNRAQHKMGAWLEAHKDLPLDQQLRLLESEPGFKKLSPERQNALRDWLKKFNSLPPKKRDQALQRMAFLSKLSPQQRQQLHEANQQLQSLPPDRKVAIHTAVRHLRQMPLVERQQVLQSDRFKSTFSDQEQKLIGQLADIDVPASGTAQNPQSK